MTTLSLSQNILTQLLHKDTASLETDETADPNPSPVCVGVVRHELTPMERESALEICELRLIHYEQMGQHQLAHFMRVCIQELEASRYPEEKA